MNIKQGDILKSKYNDETRKVLGIAGDAYFLSNYNGYDKYYAGYTLKEIEEDFELPEEKWVPKHGEVYFFMNYNLYISRNKFYNDDVDNSIIASGNYFKTEKEAQEVANKVKELLISLKQ